MADRVMIFYDKNSLLGELNIRKTDFYVKSKKAIEVYI